MKKTGTSKLQLQITTNLTHENMVSFIDLLGESVAILVDEKVEENIPVKKAEN